MRVLALIISFLIMSLILPSYADDSDETSWDSLLNTYTSAQAQKVKPVSDKDFNEALEVLKNAKNGKSPKKVNKSMPKNNEGPYNRTTSSGGSFFYQGTGALFLLLPCNLYYNDKVIPIGYYRVTPYFKDTASYLLLKQGPNEVYQLEMQNVKNVCPDQVSCFNSGVYQKNYYKLEYKDLDHSMANYFYILP